VRDPDAGCYQSDNGQAERKENPRTGEKIAAAPMDDPVLQFIQGVRLLLSQWESVFIHRCKDSCNSHAAVDVVG
jgi:hypothetical protein